MTIEARKLELVEYILQTKSEVILDQVKGIFENNHELRTLDGELLDKKRYQLELKKAEKSVFMSHEEVGRALEEW